MRIEALVPLDAPVPRELPLVGARPPQQSGVDELAGPDRDALVETIRESVQIRRRYQFFVWSQGRLRALLPHGLLVCGLPLPGSGRMFFDYFYSVPLEPATLTRLVHPRTGLAAEMMDFWMRAGGDPLPLSSADANGSSRLALEMKSLGLMQGLVHGIPSAHHRSSAHCFFAFVAMEQPATGRDISLVEFLVPHLFGAYCRAIARDKPTAAAAQTGEAELAVTEREIEILRWVREGKSNQEIGMILSISPLTVKNHVQKILRKLQASNRAQAVSKAIALRLLSNAGVARRERESADDDGSND
jgi:transcriptional regulator EpsA